MKIYVDDLRVIPNDFRGARDYNEAIRLIEKHKDEIDILSLDHDIMSYDGNGKELTGYDICLYLCENEISPSKIYIHTDNAVGDNMVSVLEGAKRRGFITSEIYRYGIVPNIYED